MEEKYIDISSKSNAFRMESYRSSGTVSSSHSSQLRCYFVRKCDFVKSNPTPAEEGNIRLVGDKIFLEKATENTLDVYENIIRQVLVRFGPVIEIHAVPNSRERES